MQKTVMTKAVAVALATLGAGAAFAQSSVTIYGNLDIAVDSVHKGQGSVANNTLFTALTAANPAAKAGFLDKSTITRVSPSISSVNAIGIKGTEDIGSGYKGSFVLEGQMGLDSGAQNGQDSRMWGRQAYLGLTTPVGEVRLGRQYAPMFYSFATVSVEALGGADIQNGALTVNNLQVRQDNQVSYWLKSGALTAVASYSPNAGVDARISSTRAPATSSTSGQILGGQTAGAESANSQGRGQTLGLFASYLVSPEMLVNAAYHSNKFGDAQLVTSSAVASTAPFSLDKYNAVSLGAKYTLPDLGTQISGIYHTGKFSMDSGSSIKVNTFAFGVKHPIDNMAVGAQFIQSKFANFTKGKDTGVMLIGDYNFSKRTKLYVRAGYVKDSAGNSAATEGTLTSTFGGGAATVTGGPLPLLTGFGSLETPFFSGGGANIDATTRVVAVGIRHSF